MRTHFNIHGLVSATLEANASDTQHFLSEFAYYRVEEGNEAPLHVDVKIGPLPDSARTAGVVVNKKFRVTDNTLYGKDSHKVANWETLVTGIDQPRTTVQLHGNRFARLVWPRWFFETLFRLKLQGAGFSMVHSSSIATRAGGNVLAASPSTGKTTLLLDWLGRGNPFCNDEYSIFKDGELYSYVTPFRFHAHNLSGSARFLTRMAEADKRQIRVRTALLKMSGGYADVTYKTGIERVFPDTEILDRVPLDGVYVLTKGDVASVELRETAKPDLARKMSVLNEFEWFGFGPYLQAWAYAHPGSELARRVDHQIALFEQEIEGRKHGEIVVPGRMGTADVNRIYEILGVPH